MAYTVVSPNNEFSRTSADFENIGREDVQRLRALASEWMEIAVGPGMGDTKKGWKALHDLKPVRPMVIFETFSVDGFVKDSELLCENKILRNVEKTMLYNIKQYHDLKDDIVFEPYFRMSWKIDKSDYGVKIEEHHAEDSLAYLSNFPIKGPDDLEKLTKRTFTAEKEYSLEIKERLEDVFGDILPVVIGNYDNFFADPGFTPFAGMNYLGLTMDLFKLIGNDNMMLWPYDHPEELHRLMRYLCDDRIRFFQWMSEEGLLDYNSDSQFAAASSYGYVSDLPSRDSASRPDLGDCWVWPESQETVVVSPEMFNEFYLKYIAEVSNMFGMAYYGCCEPVHDRIEYIKKAIPKLRAVSISGWNDFRKIGEALGGDYVHSKKPNPAFISGAAADWEGARKDLQDSFDACPGGNMEVIVRDVYEVKGDMKRLADWVKLAREVVGG